MFLLSLAAMIDHILAIGIYAQSCLECFAQNILFFEILIYYKTHLFYFILCF